MPDDLLFAQDEERVVFFCGSGVSRDRANMPDFNELADKVLAQLRATNESSAKRIFEIIRATEKQHSVRLHYPTDRIFSLLERNFDLQSIQRAVAQKLTPRDDVDLSAHRTMLKLSTLKGGQTRLITTNFDRLFEACNAKLPTRTRSDLPRIKFTDNNWGVVHLHGRVDASYQGPDRDGFVLSSAEFGGAYLAQGWAREFIRDVLDNYVAVFVGYSADDPPISYLLEGIRQTGGHRRTHYAFQPSGDGEASALWLEKGIEPIKYDVIDGRDHSNLWQTLSAWGARTADTSGWRRKVFAMARKGPAKLAPYQRGMVAHLVGSANGAQAFAKAEPPIPAEWLCVFDVGVRYSRSGLAGGAQNGGANVDPHELFGLDDDPPRDNRGEFSNPSEIPSGAWSAFHPTSADLALGRSDQLAWLHGHYAQAQPRLTPRFSWISEWLTRVAHEPTAAWWAGRQYALHHDLLSQIRWRMDQWPDPEKHIAVRRAWLAIFEYHELIDDETRYDRYELQRELKAYGWSRRAVREYARLFSPRLKLGPLYTGPLPPKLTSKLSARDLVNLSVEYPKTPIELVVPDEHLAAVLEAQRANVLLAASLEEDYSDTDFAEIEPNTAKAGENHSRDFGLSSFIFEYVDMFRSLVKFDSAAARAEFISWPRNHSIFERLQIWAAGFEEVTTADEFAALMLAVSDEAFWPFRGERDLLLSLSKRWNQLSDQSKSAIEARIMKGPNKHSRMSKADHVDRAAHWQLGRLNWLASQGAVLKLNLQKTTAALRKKAPRWKPEYVAGAADDHDGRGGYVHVDRSWKVLESLSLEQIIAFVEKPQERDPGSFTRHEPFEGLSAEAPLKAIGALALAARKGRYPMGLWERFLSSDQRAKDTARMQRLIAGRLAQLPNSEFMHVILTASRWFEAVGAKVAAMDPKLFDRTWDKFQVVLQEHPEAGRSVVYRGEGSVDWGGEAINSPTGKLAELLIKHPSTDNLERDAGLPKPWLDRAAQLLSLQGDARRFALVFLGHFLDWLYWHDKRWTEDTLLTLLDAPADGRDRDALWSGFMWGARQPAAPLYLRLKPHFLRMAKEKPNRRRHNAEILSAILLSGWGSVDEGGRRYVTTEELQDVLDHADADFLSRVLWQIDSWTAEHAEDWSPKLLDFLRTVWPKQKTARTPEISARLVEIALSQKVSFAEVAREITKLVSKVEDDHMFISELRNPEETKAFEFPRETLDLLYAVLPENPQRWPYGATAALKNLEQKDPTLLRDPKLIELKSRLVET
jgi:hypothetical protein